MKVAQRTVQPFEFIGALRAYEEGRFLLADDMGMFKTAQAIFVNNKVRERNRKLKTLVVCPTSVKRHWAMEIEKWAYPRHQNVAVLDPRNFASQASFINEEDWVITSYPLLALVGTEGIEPLYRAGFRHLILDEVHNAKNPEAIRTRTICRLAERTEHLTLLSGTPIPNTVEDVYMLMHLLDPDKYPLTEDRKVNGEARHRFKALYWQDPQAFKDLLQRKMIRRE